MSRARRLWRTSIPSRWTVLVLALYVSGTPLAAQSETAIPAKGFRADFLADLNRVEQKLVGLGEAIPEESFAWRPTEEVRSLYEVFGHVAESNDRILAALGFESSAVGEGGANAASQPEVIAGLQRSIEAVRRAVLATHDEELDVEVEFFGRNWSRRGLFYLSATHMHEHLGQAIAYARSLGVTPPWSQHLPDESGG